MHYVPRTRRKKRLLSSVYRHITYDYTRRFLYCLHKVNKAQRALQDAYKKRSALYEAGCTRNENEADITRKRLELTVANLGAQSALNEYLLTLTPNG